MLKVLVSSSGGGQCVVFLDKTLSFPNASLYPCVYMQFGTGEFNVGGNPGMA